MKDMDRGVGWEKHICYLLLASYNPKRPTLLEEVSYAYILIPAGIPHPTNPHPALSSANSSCYAPSASGYKSCHPSGRSAARPASAPSCRPNRPSPRASRIWASSSLDFPRLGFVAGCGRPVSASKCHHRVPTRRSTLGRDREALLRSLSSGCDGVGDEWDVGIRGAGIGVSGQGESVLV